MQENSVFLRTMLIAGGFVTITAGLLYFQPGVSSDPLPAPAIAPQASLSAPAAAPTAEPQIQVSRAQTGLDLTGTSTAPSVAPASDLLGRAVALSTNPQPTAAAPSGDLEALTTGLLAELGTPRTTVAIANGGGDMRAMSNGVLASLNAATGGGAHGNGQPARLENLIVQALHAGKSDSYIDALLNEAALSGQVKIPAALVTSEGRVDTATLLASLVEKSKEQTAPSNAALIAAFGQNPKPAQQPVSKFTQAQTYVVQPGDSLAAISFRFYGATNQFSHIFAANQDKLSSPDKIRIGQQLIIPAL